MATIQPHTADTTRTHGYSNGNDLGVTDGASRAAYQTTGPHYGHGSHHDSHYNHHSHHRGGDPSPLGLVSFALTLFVFGLYHCGVGIPDSNPFSDTGPDEAVFGLAVFFGGAAQFIAGLMEYRRGKTLTATIHCSYGAFWLAYAMFLVSDLDIKGAYNNNDRSYSNALGIFYIAWFLLTLIFLLSSLRTNYALLGMLAMLALSFLLLSIAHFIMRTRRISSIRTHRAGGALAFISSLFAFYAGASRLMRKDTTSFTLPLGDIGTPKVDRTDAKHHA